MILIGSTLLGGIFASAYDYGKLVRALYLKQYLKPETITNMELDRTNVTIGYSAATAFDLEWHYGMNTTTSIAYYCSAVLIHIDSLRSLGWMQFIRVFANLWHRWVSRAL